MAELIATEISGLDVANAAKVAAVTALGIRNQPDTPSTPRRNNSPPTTAQITPPRNSSTGYIQPPAIPDEFSYKLMLLNVKCDSILDSSDGQGTCK